MQLDERKMKILTAIVRNYLETGEPVGSRTISRESDLHLSSATIRNEMADLEEMGLIMQPHTSAGRVPSDQGYRVYVDAMLQEKQTQMDEMKDVLIQRQERLEDLLKQVVKLLATNTNYATMISAPAAGKNRLKFLQVSRMSADQILATIVMEGNVIRNKMLDVDEDLDEQAVLKLNILMNSTLSGLAIEEINLGMIAAMKQQAGVHGEIIAAVIDAACESIRDSEGLEIYTSGANNIFRYPELADHNRARDLISTFEEKERLSGIVEETLSAADKERGIQVYIGNEMPVQEMKDCSVVTATYELGEGIRGTIGVIGPKRMDYDRVVTILKDIMQQMDRLYERDG